jgi:hypothetical protein
VRFVAAEDGFEHIGEPLDTGLDGMLTSRLHQRPFANKIQSAQPSQLDQKSEYVFSPVHRSSP